jgi:hypothetical protein
MKDIHNRRRLWKGLGLFLSVVVLVIAVMGCTAGGSISVTAELTYKSTGTQADQIQLSGSGEVTVSEIWLTNTTNFSLEGAAACERVYKSSSPECTFNVKLTKYEKGKNGLVFVVTSAGTLETHLIVD